METDEARKNYGRLNGVPHDAVNVLELIDTAHKFVYECLLWLTGQSEDNQNGFLLCVQFLSCVLFMAMIILPLFFLLYFCVLRRLWGPYLRDFPLPKFLNSSDKTAQQSNNNNNTGKESKEEEEQQKLSEPEKKLN